MNKIFDEIVGPLDKRYCYYFYFVAILFFIGFIVSSIKFISLVLTSKKVMSANNLNFLFVVSHSFILYLVNRILYNMCTNSI